ncbi:MAG: CapA family protein [Pseudonocardiaceae bacterium]
MSCGLTLFLCGDVMSGRGVDQIFAYPGVPTLREEYVSNARAYVESAEAVHGRINCPVPFCWPWGDALRTLDDLAPDFRVINLETCITRSDDFEPWKGIHYRMNPANISFLTAGRPDVCVLANNHVLDFGPCGLEETLEELGRAGLRWVGAGCDAARARRPVAVSTADGTRRLVVLSAGVASSGIPPDWAATEDRPGVNVIPDLSDSTAARIIDELRGVQRPGDALVVSIHWGSNWGYEVPEDQIHFAHQLVDGGVHIVHGHSSHHPRPLEVYRDRLILYGCGDLINDYEGISGQEMYRNDLRLLYLPSVEPHPGRLTGLRMLPVQARQMRLRHACRDDSEWLRGVLTRVSRRFGTRVDLDPDGMLVLRRTRDRPGTSSGPTGRHLVQ